MNAPFPIPAQLTRPPSEAARQRMSSCRGEPLFIAAWRRVLMMHFEVDAGCLRHDVPFPLHLCEGRAFVSLVAFSMEGMRPRFGGRWMARLFQPIATHDFLNVRTYVIHSGEPGIHFLAEWLTSRLAVKLGPATFGLPYRHGRIDYDLGPQSRPLRGRVVDVKTRAEFAFEGELPSPASFQPCETNSLAEWLMERYIAFNSAGGRRRYFRVWHPPWLQSADEIQLNRVDLLTTLWPWFKESRLVGANYSPGFDAVWMGWPHRST